MRWVTEITQSEEGEYFIDEQRFDPIDSGTMRTGSPKRTAGC